MANKCDESRDDLHVNRHHKPDGIGDWLAYRLVRFLRLIADKFFAKRYGHRAVVLETIAAVPGMVAGAFQHLKSLRKMKDDEGWIRTLLDEAENERMHLMTFVQIAQPNRFERFLVAAAQIIFYISYSMLYLFSSKTAHRVVGYLEEEAVESYTRYLKCIDEGKTDNISAPAIAIKYWKLSEDARLRDVVKVIRTDEMQHREVNHCLANKLEGKECQIQTPEHISDKRAKTLKSYASRSAP